MELTLNQEKIILNEIRLRNEAEKEYHSRVENITNFIKLITGINDFKSFKIENSRLILDQEQIKND
jgi:hypothetical protein